MQKSQSKKRFLSIRLTEDELKEIYRQCEKSTCRSLTEYSKKVLAKKPVIVKIRNESQEDLLQVMTGIRNRLDQLTEQAREKGDILLLKGIGEIRSLTRQIFRKWSR